MIEVQIRSISVLLHHCFNGSSVSEMDIPPFSGFDAFYAELPGKGYDTDIHMLTNAGRPWVKGKLITPLNDPYTDKPVHFIGWEVGSLQQLKDVLTAESYKKCLKEFL